MLACAVIERVIVEGQPLEFWIDGYEIDPKLAQIAKEALERAAQVAANYGVIVHIGVYEENFILNNRPVSQPYLLLAENSNRPDAYAPYTHIIANPPYYKLNSNDPHVKAIAGQIKGHTNIYSLFLALAAKKLLPGGHACFILPRSFCSGAYFSALRQELIAETLPIAVHVFESRQDTFEADTILQENIIFTFRRRKARSAQIPPAAYVSISASRDSSSLHNSKLLSRTVSFHQFLDNRYGDYFFRLPTGELDEQLIEMVNQWSGSLNQYGLNVSTGPVVAFRAQTWLTNIEEVTRHQAVPLLWLQNVKQHRVEWPVSNGNKPQAISLAEEAHSLLVPIRNYVLLRRFSAKEEPRRLIAAPFLADQYNYRWLGLENHLNYVYKKQDNLTKEETLGLSALFNSALMDRYFRIVNGNTQVNATELRALPLPPLELIRNIGREISETNKALVDPELIVFKTLRFSGHLSPDFPLIKETRIAMGKIQEAQEILKILGLPPAQQNEISALTLLVLAQLSEETPWSAAQGANLRIHDILTEIKKYYAREYAENTRETIRRQVIHQFIQAGLVTRNPDDLSLPTNSPRTHYALTEAAIQTIKTLGVVQPGVSMLAPFLILPPSEVLLQI